MTDSPMTAGKSTGAPPLWLLLGAGVLGAAGCAALAFQDAAAFWTGYLIAAEFWMGVSLGCLGITLLHGMTAGRWGRSLARSLHAGITTVLLALIACWIMALGAQHVFPWAGTASMRATLNAHQQLWLAPQWVVIRFVIAGLLWLGTGAWLQGRYKQEAAHPEQDFSNRLSAVGLMVFFVTVSICTIDFMMALTPEWASSMFPLIRIMNLAVSGMAMAVIARNGAVRDPGKSELDLVQDSGSMMFAFNMLWTYTSFSQYLLIWGADLPEESEYYLVRRTALGATLALMLFFLHYVVPFVLLLSKNIKRSPRGLSWVAALLLAMCLADNAWVVLPAMHVSLQIAILSTLASALAIGGAWLAVFYWSFARLPELAAGPVPEYASAASAADTLGEAS